MRGRRSDELLKAAYIGACVRARVRVSAVKWEPSLRQRLISLTIKEIYGQSL